MPKASELKCYFGCEVDGPLHRFPAKEYPSSMEKFEQWKSTLDINTQERGDNFIYNSVRFCYRHFEDCYRLPSKRLTKNAIPTLNLLKDNQTAKQSETVASSSGANNTNVRGSSSSSTSSSPSSSSFGSNSKRLHHIRSKLNKRSKHSDHMVDKLFKEMGEMGKKNYDSNIITHLLNDDSGSICLNVSGKFDNNSVTEDAPPASKCPRSTLDFPLEIEAKTEEPSVTKTPDKNMEMLLGIQHFGNSSWSEIRLADAQKQYIHSPGFIDLESNNEVKPYDSLHHLASSEKAYAALSFCILKQQEAIQDGIHSLLSWAKDRNIDMDDFSAKIYDVFSKGNFHKISSDLLQMVSGHRAECIEMRRENILSQVLDPLVKAALNKIPPTSSYLFDPEQFSSTLERAGGVQKCFFPQKSEGSSQN